MTRLAGNPRMLAWLLFLPVFLVAFSETVLSLYKRWVQFDEAYGHGFLVLLIVVYLLYDRKKEIINTRSEPKLYLAIPLLLLNAVWFLAFQTDIEIIQQMSLPVMLMLVITLVHGIRMLKILWFPVAFLFFAIPAWDYLNDLLISLTVAVVSYLVRFSGITAFIEADRVTLSSGTIVIAAGCSGLRYLIICTALASLAAYLTDGKTALRSLVVLLGIMIGLLTNWIRVYLLVLVGYYTEMESGLIQRHEMFGWILFLIFFSPIYYLIFRIRKIEPPVSSNEAKIEVEQGSGNHPAAWILACLTACSGPLAASITSIVPDQYQAATPDLAGYGRFQSQPQDPYEAVYFLGDKIHRPAQASAVVYESNLGNIQVASAIYRKNNATKNYLPYYRRLADPEEWHSEREGSRTVSGHQRGLQIKELEIIRNRTGNRKLIWYWYDIGGRVSHNKYIAKILEIGTLFTGRNYAGLTIIQADCETECEGFRDTFTELAQHADRAFALALSQ